MENIRLPIKELSFCHKLWFYNSHIFSTWRCKPFIFQIIIIWSKMIQSLKYLWLNYDSNAKYVYEGGRVLVVQAYAYTKYLGKVDLVFSESGDLLDWLGDPILLDSSVPKVRWRCQTKLQIFSFFTNIL